MAFSIPFWVIPFVRKTILLFVVCGLHPAFLARFHALVS